MYLCDACDYNTKYKSNYNRHLLSANHEKNLFVCEKCSKKYTSKSSFYKHTNSCNVLSNFCGVKEDAEKHNDRSEELIEILKEQLKVKDEQLKAKEDLIKNILDKGTKQTTEDRRLLKAVINSTGSIVQKSMGSLSFAVDNYYNAPRIEYIDSHTQIIKKNAKYNDKIKFVDDTIHKFNHKLISNFLGDIILANYQKENPNEQSIWSTDVSRLAYIVNDVVGKDDEHVWIVDKKGAKAIKYIIKPITIYLKEAIKEYMEYKNKMVIGETDINKANDIMKNMSDAMKIMNMIDDGSLEESILRYLASPLKIIKNCLN